MWRQIGVQLSIISPEHYGHVDWSMYMLPFCSLNSFVTILFSVLWLFFSFVFNSLGLLSNDSVLIFLSRYDGIIADSLEAEIAIARFFFFSFSSWHKLPCGVVNHVIFVYTCNVVTGSWSNGICDVLHELSCNRHDYRIWAHN